jgi:hypothetical protein
MHWDAKLGAGEIQPTRPTKRLLMATEFGVLSQGVSVNYLDDCTSQHC